ncbi:MAG TPA: hypothetical protein VHV47_02655, partial [Opitutaceae bacterium]|jgi:hypothetical protein|nr:hypothetical protein [Opitutaceae bacterium]
MSMRIRRLLTLLAFLPAALPLRSANLDGSSPAAGDAEARRLYDDANAEVTNVTEGPYSYAYIQFYWKRAETFLERAERVYPGSPAGQALRSGELKVGPFSLNYFRDRVLPRLEQKRISSFDPVNCAIFLYERNRTRTDPEHVAAFEDIIEVMSRQARWGEVLGFPAEGAMRTDLLRVMFREAVRSRNDEHVIINQLLTAVPAAEQARADFPENQAEAMALLGTSRPVLADFLAKHPQDSVKAAALAGMADRELQIRRRAALHIAVGGEIDGEHYFLLHLEQRDDVEAVARQFWPKGALPAAAKEALGAYRAGLGRRPAGDVPLAVQLAYLDYLGAFEKFDELEAYPDAAGLAGADREAAALKLVEIYARNGRRADAERWASAARAGGPADADLAGLADLRGRLDSRDDPFIVRQGSFADLPIQDPCVLAQAVMEWSLTPVRTLRGAAPWDAVVRKYQPGFDHLPLPTSEEVRRAASFTAPY